MPPIDSSTLTPCPRNVYVATFVERTGHRWVYSVDSMGVRVGLKMVPPDGDLGVAVDALWEELDAMDPPNPLNGSRHGLTLIS